MEQIKENDPFFGDELLNYLLLQPCNLYEHSRDYKVIWQTITKITGTRKFTWVLLANFGAITRSVIVM